MKNIKKAIHIQILCFQLLFGQSLMANNYEYEVASGLYKSNFKSLSAKLSEFKFALVGGEKAKECEKKAIEDTKKATDESFGDFLAKIPVVTKGSTEEVGQEECKPERIAGHLDSIVEKIIQSEENNKGVAKVAKVTADDLQALEFQRKASSLKFDIMEFARNKNFTTNERRLILLNYLNDVALPIRDYFIATESYLEKYTKDISSFINIALPSIPSDLLEGDDAKTFVSQIEVGLNPSVSPFHLKLEMPLLFGEPKVVYDQAKILGRDSLSILKAPTSLNYVKALKWMTIQMMITQKKSYNAMNNDFSDIEVPNSCQTKDNGRLSAIIKNEYTPAQANEILDNILINQKMVISEDNSDFIEFYLHSVDRNPMVEGYSGLMPFENYRHARQGVDKVEHSYLIPDIDDRSHYQMIVDLRMNKALSHFENSRSWLFGLINLEDHHYSGSSLFESFFTIPQAGESYNFEDEKGERVEIPTAGLSIYMAKLMRRHKVIDWIDLVGKDLEGFLKSQNITVDFPSLYSSSIRKQWALRELNKWFSGSKERGLSGTEELILKKVCGYGKSRGVSFCRDLDAKKIASHLVDYLNSLRSGDDYIPTRIMDNEKHLVRYQLLSQIWNRLVEASGAAKVFKPAFTNEYDYLLDQFEYENPWARARLSYLLALDELGAIREGKIPEFSMLSSAEKSLIKSDLGSLERPSKSLVRRLHKAAHSVGINNTLHPAYGNYILKKDEKEYVWNESLKKTSELFRIKDRDGRELYQKLDKISAQTFLKRSQIDTFMQNVFGESQLDDQSQEIIEAILESEIGEKAQVMIELYNQKGNPEKQAEIYESFVMENGLDQNFTPKVNFLMLDNLIKGEVYKSFLRAGAKIRSQGLLNGLETLCGMKTETFEDIKALYFSTVKQQNALNSVAGGKSPVSQEALQKIEAQVTGMSHDEKKDMKRGLGLMAAAIGTMALAGSCVATAGLTCALALGLGSVTMGTQVMFAKRELKRKLKGDELTLAMEKLKDFGLTDSSSIDELRRGWGWFVFESISVIPLSSLLARSAKLTANMLTSSRVALTRNAGGRWKAFKKTAQSVVTETDVNTSTLVLGFEGYGKQAVNFAKGLKSNLTQNSVMSLKENRRNVARVERLKRLHKARLISTTSYTRAIEKIMKSSQPSNLKGANTSKNYVSGTTVKYTTKEVNEQTAKVVSEYLGGSSKAMQYLLKTYKKRLPKATAGMEKVRSRSEIRFLRSPFKKMGNFIGEMRFKHLDEYKKTIIRLSKEIDSVVKNGGDLSEYILKNVDDLTDVFMQIPMRKRELPYMFLFQGGFHVGKSGATLSNSAYKMTNGLVMKKFFTARSTLVYEAAKSKARTDLGLAAGVSTYSSFEVFESFVQSVSKSLKSADSEAIESTRKEFENQISEKIASVKPEVGLDEIKRVLFTPKNLQDKASAEVLWNSVKSEELLGLDVIQKQAHRIVQESYNTANEFERFLSALKVIVLERNAGKIEIM